MESVQYVACLRWDTMILGAGVESFQSPMLKSSTDWIEYFPSLRSVSLWLYPFLWGQALVKITVCLWQMSKWLHFQLCAKSRKEIFCDIYYGNLMDLLWLGLTPSCADWASSNSTTVVQVFLLRTGSCGIFYSWVSTLVNWVPVFACVFLQS